MFDLSFLGKLFGRGRRRQQAPVRRPVRIRPGLESLEDRLTPSNVSTSLVETRCRSFLLRSGCE
jgi:hypothetical protein